MPHTAPNDEPPIVLTPITRPDPAVGRARARVVKWAGGAVALALVGAGVSWWVAVANEDRTATRHTAAFPGSFGSFTRAKADQSLWSAIGGDSTDRATGGAELTYRAADSREAMISVDLDLPTSSYDDDPDGLKAFAKYSTTPAHVTVYPAGKHGGGIKCEDITGAKGPFTYCVWESPHRDDVVNGHWTMEARVTYLTFRGGAPAASPSAPLDLRAFLDEVTFGTRQSA